MGIHTIGIFRINVIIVFGRNIYAAIFYLFRGYNNMQTNRAGHRCVDNKFHVKEIRSKMYVFCLFTFTILPFIGGEYGPCTG